MLNASQPRAAGAPDVSPRMPDSVAKVVAVGAVPLELVDEQENKVLVDAQANKHLADGQENKDLVDAQEAKVLAEAREHKVLVDAQENSVPADVEAKRDLKNVPLAVANKNLKDAALVTAEEVAKTISSTAKKTSLVELVEMLVASRVLKLNRNRGAGFKRNEMMIGESNESSLANQRNLASNRRSRRRAAEASKNLKDEKAGVELVPAVVDVKIAGKNVLLADANRNSKGVTVGAEPVLVEVKIVASSSHIVAVEASCRAITPGKKKLVVVGASRNLKGEKADAETLPEEEAQQESVLMVVGAKKVGKSVLLEVADASKNLMAMDAKADAMPVPEVEDGKPRQTTSAASSNSTVANSTRKMLPVPSMERTLSSRILNLCWRLVDKSRNRMMKKMMMKLMTSMTRMKAKKTNSSK